MRIGEIRRKLADLRRKMGDLWSSSLVMSLHLRALFLKQAPGCPLLLLEHLLQLSALFFKFFLDRPLDLRSQRFPGAEKSQWAVIQMNQSMGGSGSAEFTHLQLLVETPLHLQLQSQGFCHMHSAAQKSRTD